MTQNPFSGCIPALMTPCTPDRAPDTAALVRKAKELTAAGMSAVVYCGSMGDWPLLTDDQRMAGVAALVAAGVPTIVGTGAINTKSAVAHAAHAAEVGAQGLMAIPRVLSRGTSTAAQEAHFKAVLTAAPDLPAVIYNSPYYGFATRAELFFALRDAHANLVGFKEFGGADDLRYAAEHITSRDEGVTLMIGVDTTVFHGYVNCGARGVITGIGNALPKEVLHLVALPRRPPRRRHRPLHNQRNRPPNLRNRQHHNPPYRLHHIPRVSEGITQFVIPVKTGNQQVTGHGHHRVNHPHRF